MVTAEAGASRVDGTREQWVGCSPWPVRAASGRCFQPGQQPPLSPLEPLQNEVFASRHQDQNSVACIEEKCYVLTFAEYCRWVEPLESAPPPAP